MAISGACEQFPGVAFRVIREFIVTTSSQRVTDSASVDVGWRRWPRRVATVLTVAPLLRDRIIAWSVPTGTPQRRACDRCAAPIGLDRPLRPLTPVARCARCGGRAGAPTLTVEAALIAVLVLLWASGLPPFELAAVGAWLLCAVPLGFIDVAVHRLPDRLTWPANAAVALLLGAAVLWGPADGGGWLRAAVAGAGLAACFAASALLLGERGFGLGDAKLALGAGALLGWLGWGALVFGLFVTFLAAGLAGVVGLVAGRLRWSGHLPFGPFLIVGVAAAVAVLG